MAISLAEAKRDVRTLATKALYAADGNVDDAVRRLNTAIANNAEGSRLLAAITVLFVEQLKASMPPIKPIRVKQHRRSKPRTEEQKAATLIGMAATSRAIMTAFDRHMDGRRLGDIRWGELTTVRERLVVSLINALQVGRLEVENIILIDKIIAHIRVPDHTIKIADAVSAKQLEEFTEQARAEAPGWAARGVHAYIASLQEARTGELSHE